MKLARIVVPVDFSPAALYALDYAVALAKRTSAEVVVLFVVEPLTYGLATMRAVMREREHVGQLQLERLETKMRNRGVHIRTHIHSGVPAEVITSMAKRWKADLIVVGTHGRSGLAHMLLGSVAERVVRDATCPVLTVRESSSTGRRRRSTTTRRGGRTQAHRRRSSG
jgi:universal stress protein A